MHLKPSKFNLIKAKKDRHKENSGFSAACGIEKKIVREENEIEKNESEDGVVEHSKVQALESIDRSARNLEPRGI